ncbi:Sulfate transporter [Araneus ventricosus]|uniref:Sulfate transporter n=1 Tax=Araneus ventricosus TaxID=182803 RepID=A0A4Y2EPI6_ARAVE|nr:Sulfate transporter [Araneus ventricosus]
MESSKRKSSIQADKVNVFNVDGDAVTDSERVKILSGSPDVKHEISSSSNLQTDNQHRSSLNDVSSLGSIRRKQVTNANNELFQADSSFYNMGFSLSPSDLERSWKSGRPSMNGSISENGLRRTKSECKISINRNPVDNSYIDKKFGPIPSETSYKKAAKYLKSRCACNLACLLSFITSLFPVLSWLPKYKREFLIPDLIAGFTISILHIPQGMAYGVLAALKAENGLYVSFFPVLIYFLLGTSRHISVGTFAVISLMLSSAIYGSGAVVSREFNSTSPIFSNGSLRKVEDWPPTHLETATTLAMAVGFWQLFMGVFRLGSLTVVLSDQLVSGFSSGAACHVATSQLKDLFGIHIGRYSGTLKLIYMLRDVFTNLINTNPATVIISAIALFILAVFKEQIDGRLKGRLKMPIPIDLIVVVIATTISYFSNFHSNYKVSVIQDIPIGLPSPTPPRLDILPHLIGDSFAIAIVAYAISLSMAKLLSKKHKYAIRPNQELLALGCANVFASFFSCYPCSASLSRSLVQERSGGRTQVAGLVSCSILLVILLALAPMFYSLPKCILSCIILVALKPMFLQMKDFYKAWRISKLDACIWLVTFLSTVLLDVTYGLLAGVIFSLGTVIIRSVLPTKTFLGRIPDTDIYLDSKRYDMAHEIKGIKIFHFESALYFINKELFKSSLMKYVPLKTDDGIKVEDRIHRIIIDCSTFTFIDISGLETLLEIIQEYQEVGIAVFLSGCSVSMQSVMEHAKFYERVSQHPAVFPTIHDAVEFQYLPHNSISNS